MLRLDTTSYRRTWEPLQRFVCCFSWPHPRENIYSTSFTQHTLILLLENLAEVCLVSSTSTEVVKNITSTIYKWIQLPERHCQDESAVLNYLISRELSINIFTIYCIKYWSPCLQFSRTTLRVRNIMSTRCTYYTPTWKPLQAWLRASPLSLYASPWGRSCTERVQTATRDLHVVVRRASLPARSPCLSTYNWYHLTHHHNYGCSFIWNDLLWCPSFMQINVDWFNRYLV